jgi:hypothetical protein
MNMPPGEPRFPEPMDPLPTGTRPAPRRFQYAFGGLPPRTCSTCDHVLFYGEVGCEFEADTRACAYFLGTAGTPVRVYPTSQWETGVWGWLVSDANVAHVATWTGGVIGVTKTKEYYVEFPVVGEIMNCGGYDEQLHDRAFPGDWVVKLANGVFGSFVARAFHECYGLSDPDEMLENPSSPNTPATDQASTGVNKNQKEKI